MNGLNARWCGWSAGNLPCLFSSDQSKANADFLLGGLSSDFIGAIGNIRKSHVILKLWDSPGPDSYLRLNSLAEDLKLLVGKSSVDAALRDLKDDHSCESAWHTIHTAALFERAKPGAVVRFVDARNDVSPDFIVNLGGQEIPVEAKLLMRSEVEESFQSAAQRIIETALKELNSRADEISLFVVVKDALVSPSEHELSLALQNLPTKFEGQIQRSFSHFRMLAERIPEGGGIGERRMVHVLAPLHEKEYLRIRNSASQASKQLRAFEVAGGSGILALGLTSQQNPHLVVSVLGNQMKQNRYRAIAAALLIKTGTYVQPPRATIVDHLEIRINEFATKRINLAIPLLPLDLYAKLTDAEPPQLDQPAYVRAISSGKVVDVSKGAAVWLPNIRRIATELLV